MNFLIVNGAVIVPQYGDEYDSLALEQIQEMFPDRKVVGVETTEIIYGGGSIHCVTRHQPAAISKSRILLTGVQKFDMGE